MTTRMNAIVNQMQEIISSKDFSKMDAIIDDQQDILSLTDQYRKSQLKRLKSEVVGTRNSLLYIGLLHETRNLLLHLVNLIKAHRDFVLNQLD